MKIRWFDDLGISRSVMLLIINMATTDTTTAPRPAPWAVTLVGAGCPVPCRRSPPAGRQSVRLLSWCPHTGPDGRGRAGAGGLHTHSWRCRRHSKAARQSP